MTRTAASAVISNAAASFDKKYTYLVPPELESRLKAGMRVVVPFGKAGKHTVALVMDIFSLETDGERLKSIISLVDGNPLVGGEMLALIERLKETVFCTYYDAYRCMVPSGFGYKLKTHYKPALTDLLELTLDDREAELMKAVLSASDASGIDALFESDDPAEKRRLSRLALSLEDKGALERTDALKRRVGDKTELNAELSEKYLSNELEESSLSTKQRAVVKLLKEGGAASVEEICYMAGCTKAVIERLKAKGVVRLYETEIFRPASLEADERKDPEEIILNDEQQAAFDGISALIDTGKPAGALLYGVTGSGKTSVFYKLISHALKQGKTALMMVPEISLTPQAVKNFKTYFGSDVALLHSSLSLGSRADEFKRIRSGQARIVIGTRSAVFAPLKNIGIIIMDEEGERTYKSDSSPRYHARDVAAVRCGTHNCVLLLASATPSIESYYYAKTGRYSLFEMKKRYSGNALPTVELIDMQNEPEPGCILSRRLTNEIENNLISGGQTILLLNRRGYSPYVSCRSCRRPLVCPNCSIPLTYHKKNGRLMCHFCGFSSAFPKSCPECGSDKLAQSGAGTQKIEDELAEKFPQARILRMDADTTFSRFAYENSFAAFEKGEYDIMLGTQMIAKGLDFPNVTLVGVVSIDKSLFLGDFRSYERTFSLITQVAGRSGRAGKAGKAFIQTYVPEHYVIELAARQDYPEFYEQESQLRKALLYPPFCDICSIAFAAVLESAAIEASRAFHDMLKEYLAKNSSDVPIRVLGCAPCGVGRPGGKYRYRIIIKCRLSAGFRKMIRELSAAFCADRRFSNVKLTVDINGDIN